MNSGLNPELSDVYSRPGLPPKCAGEIGSCALGGCDGLASVAVTELVATRTGSYLQSETGRYCPAYQTATPDGRVYSRSVPAEM